MSPSSDDLQWRMSAAVQRIEVSEKEKEEEARKQMTDGVLADFAMGVSKERADPREVRDQKRRQREEASSTF